MSEVFKAVELRDVDRIRDILRRDPLRITDQDEYYDVAVVMICPAIMNGNVLNDDPDFKDQDSIITNSLLLGSIGQNVIETIKMLVADRAYLNFQNQFNLTLLHRAMRDEVKKGTVELLLRLGADVNAANCFYCTPLDNAICYKNVDTARILINAGGKARKVFTAAYYTHGYGNDPKLASTIELLIQKGAEIDLSGRFSVRALYYTLAKSHDVQLVEKVMVEQGVDVDELKRQGKGMTELHVAAQKADEARVKTLLEAGADVNTQNVLGETPLHVLLDNARKDDDRYYRSAKLLIEAGADLLEIRDIFDVTPFQRAMLSKSSKIFNLILATISGVEESTLKKSVLESLSYDTIQLAYQSYPLAIAIELGYEEVVDHLIGLRHHIEVKSNISYRPPIFHAVQWRNFRITKMLLEADCPVNCQLPCHQRLPFFKFTSCDNDLRIISILWEFNCISTLRKLSFDALRDKESQPNENKLTLLLVFYHLFADVLDESDKQFILPCIFRSNKKLEQILISVCDRIEKFDEDLICSDKSKLDFLAMKLNSLVCFLNDKNNLKVCQELCSSLDGKEEWDSCEMALKFRIDLAMEKRRILDSAKDCLNKALWDAQKSLPDEIIDKILSYLNVRELKKMSIKD